MQANIDSTRGRPDQGRCDRIVVIDDSQNDFVITRKLLSRSSVAYDVEWARSYEEGLRRISDDAAAAYLVDYRLGPRSGLQLIEHARSLGSNKPLLLLTGTRSAGLLEAAMQAGATDFLDKEHGDEANTLERRVRRAIQRESVLAKLRADNQRIPRNHPTELASRALLMDRLNEALERVRLDGESGFTVACLSVENLQGIRDDRVVQEVARRLASAVRDVDTVARLDRGEFAVLFEECSDDACAEMLRRVCLTLDEPVPMRGDTIELGWDVGLAVALDDRRDATTLLEDARRAMHQGC